MTFIKDMINSPPIHPSFPKSKGIVKSLLTLLFFPCSLPVDVSHQESVLFHNHQDTFIFFLLSNTVDLEVITSDLLHLVFISYLAYRNDPVKIPQCLALPIAAHLAHCCQLNLPWTWHSHAQKQANAPKSSVFFLFLFCEGNKIQTV